MRARRDLGLVSARIQVHRLGIDFGQDQADADFYAPPALLRRLRGGVVAPRCARHQAAAHRADAALVQLQVEFAERSSPVDQSAAGKCRHPARDRGQRVPSPATASCVADRVCPYRRRAAGSTAAIPSPLKRCTQSRTVWQSIPHWAPASARRSPSSTNAIANVPRARGTGIAQRHWGVVGSWRQNAMAFSPLPRPDTSDVPAQ